MKETTRSSMVPVAPTVKTLASTKVEFDQDELISENSDGEVSESDEVGEFDQQGRKRFMMILCNVGC